jgi:hypothetical protein
MGFEIFVHPAARPPCNLLIEAGPLGLRPRLGGTDSSY